MVHDGMTDFGQGRAAALKSSSLPGDDWSTKASVQAVNEQPRPPVRHPHLTARFRNRAVPVDHFHQLDLARSNRARPVEVDAQRQPRHGFAAALVSAATSGEIGLALFLMLHFGAAAEGWISCRRLYMRRSPSVLCPSGDTSHSAKRLANTCFGTGCFVGLSRITS
jgi:hypothetical protein